MNFEQHRQKMIQHFLYLRQRDQDYAREALRDYVVLSNCPFPLIEADVREAWQDLQAATGQSGISG